MVFMSAGVVDGLIIGSVIGLSQSVCDGTSKDDFADFLISKVTKSLIDDGV